MRLPRFGLACVMGLVLVAALDFALIRTSKVVTGGLPGDLWLQLIVLCVLPMANLLVVALYLYPGRSGPGRRFLAGFAISGAISSAVIIALASSLDVDVLAPIIRSVGQPLRTFLFGASGMLNTSKIMILSVVFASVAALPQVLLALIVGAIARRHGKARSNFPTPESTSE